MADFLIQENNKGDKLVGSLPPSNHNDILSGDMRHGCTLNIISTKARQADTFGKMEVFVMSKLIDLEGQRFGKWVVSTRAKNTNQGQARWECVCECGNVSTVAGQSLREGKSTRCSRCVGHETSKRLTTHGDARTGGHTRLFNIWLHMKYRCSKENNSDYRWYGARGISVCNDWERDYSVFKQWALENGYQEHLTIERSDNDKGYNPDNCEWITQSENSRRRNLVSSNLTVKKIKQIKKLLSDGFLKHREIGEMFSVRRRVISKIKNGETWAWVLA